MKNIKITKSKRWIKDDCTRGFPSNENEQIKLARVFNQRLALVWFATTKSGMIFPVPLNRMNLGLFICVLAIVLQAKAYQLLMTYSALYVKLLMSRRLTGPSHHRLRPRRNHCSVAPFCLCQYIRKKILQWRRGQLSSRDSCTRNCWTTLVYLEDFFEDSCRIFDQTKNLFLGGGASCSSILVPFRRTACCCLPADASAPVLCLHQTDPCLFGPNCLRTLPNAVCLRACWKKLLNNICILVQETLRGLLFLLTFQYQDVNYWDLNIPRISICTVWPRGQCQCCA